MAVQTYKTIGTLLIEVTGEYDNKISKKLGKWLKEQPFEEGVDFDYVKMPAPDGSGKIIGAKLWKKHTWNKIKKQIKSVQVLLKEHLI